MSGLPVRRRPASGVIVVDGAPTIVFITVCTHQRRAWLATRAVHDLLVRTWQAADNWAVGRYVVMPDHVHLFAAPRNPDARLDSWVKYWKGMFTRAHRAESDRWQAGFWDRRLRHGESYAQKWSYVVENPVRHRLVATSVDWPFQGELELLAWDE